MGGEKRYVYGVIESEPVDVAVDGVGERNTVDTVAYRDHAAVVQDIDTMDPEQTEENLSAHDDVLRAVMTAGDGRAVVPMQFGMVFVNDRALKNVLRNGRRAFRKALSEVEGTVELGVKIIGPEDGSVDREAVRDTVETVLDPESEEVSAGEQFSDRLLVNRAYLVSRSNQEAFDEAIDRVEEAHDDVTVQYTGPWAPYNFVDIEIGVEQ